MCSIEICVVIITMSGCPMKWLLYGLILGVIGKYLLMIGSSLVDTLTKKSLPFCS